MDLNTKIFLSGGAGFIGANVIKYLNSLGYQNIDIFEPAGWPAKWKNLIGLKYNGVYGNYGMLRSIDNYIKDFNKKCIVIHLGANSATSAEPTNEIFEQNTLFSNELIDLVKEKPESIKLIHSSSASVYGSEEQDFIERVAGLKPINFYAWTKLKTDEHLESLGYPKNVYSLRFFNVYGSKLEQYKGPMASVIYKWLTQKIDKNNPIQLFKSLRADYEDGMQQRDFIHISDICKIIHHCMVTENDGGLFNCGTGKTGDWLEIAGLVLKHRKLGQSFANYIDYVKFIDMPEALKDKYQYRTCANIDRLRNVLGYKEEFIGLDEGIKRAFNEING